MCLSRKLVWCTVKVTLNSATITYSSSYLDESFEKYVDDCFLVYPSPLDPESILFTAYFVMHYYSWSVVSQTC